MPDQRCLPELEEGAVPLDSGVVRAAELHLKAAAARQVLPEAIQACYHGRVSGLPTQDVSAVQSHKYVLSTACL